jgi:hypothetical protein
MSARGEPWGWATGGWPPRRRRCSGGAPAGFQVHVAPRLALTLRSELIARSDGFGPLIQSTAGLRWRPGRAILGASVGFGGNPQVPQFGWVLTDIEAGGLLGLDDLRAGPHVQVSVSAPVQPRTIFGYRAWFYVRPGVIFSLDPAPLGSATVSFSALITLDTGLGWPQLGARLVRADTTYVPGVVDGAWFVGSRASAQAVIRLPGW